MRRRALVIAALAALSLPAVAGAHPLGNFTINHYSRVEVSGNRVYVLYVLDMAEIPTFRVRQSMGNPNTYASNAARRTAREVELRVDGALLPLAPIRKVIAFPPGAAGLKTLRFEVLLRSARLEATGSPRSLSYHDGTYAGRIGWKEVTVQAAGDARLTASSVSQTSISDELLAYPRNLLRSPPEVTSAQASVRPGSSVGPVPTLLSADELSRKVAVRASGDKGFTRLIAARRLSTGFVLVSLLVALFWGAAHAFSPGHGKAIVAGYLVGARGRPRDAVALGVIVTATHTAGVFALGAVTLLLSAFIVPEQLYPWLNLASALLVVGVGLTILRWRIHSWQRGEPLGGHHHHHHGEKGHHHHDGGHEHGVAEPAYGHDHSHGNQRQGLLGVGVAAGIIPCPTALVVLLAAISLQRVAFGLVLIVAFSVGLAVSVTSIGLLAVAAKRTFSRMSFEGPAIRALPAVSAIVVLALGFVMTVRALHPLI